MDQDRLIWVGVALLWLLTALALRRSRPPATMAALVAITWLATGLTEAAVFWHRGPLVHLLLAAGAWWPRSKVARLAVVGGYALAASPTAWPIVEVSVAGVGLVLVAAATEHSARPATLLRRAPWRVAIALWCAATLVPPVLAWAGVGTAWAAGVLLGYSGALALVAFLVVLAVRPWRTPWATDLAVDLGGMPAEQLRELLAPRMGEPGALRREVDSAVQAADRLRTRLAQRQGELDTAIAETESSWRRLTAADAEARHSLVEQLHLLTGPRLARVVGDLRVVTADATGPEASAVARARSRLVSAVEELDALGRGLRPAVLGEGLVPAVRVLADAASVPVVVRVRDPERIAALRPETARTAYFVTAECVTNAIKHARATLVTVEIAHTGPHLDLVVTDDGVGGVGLDSSDATRTGLRGVQHRVHEAGGRLTVTSPADGGTRVRAVLPVPP